MGLDVNDLVSILVYLVCGSYIYITGGVVWLHNLIMTLRDNHIKHLDDRIKALEHHARTGNGTRLPRMPDADD
jgi:hypothetical protein